jgi:hypothetical protein
MWGYLRANTENRNGCDKASSCPFPDLLVLDKNTFKPDTKITVEYRH